MSEISGLHITILRSFFVSSDAHTNFIQGYSNFNPPQTSSTRCLLDQLYGRAGPRQGREGRTGVGEDDCAVDVL